MPAKKPSYLSNKLLARSYPAPEGNWRTAVATLLFGLFIALFLLFFEPFEIQTSTYTYPVVALGTYGLISTIVLFGLLVVMPRLWPGLFHDRHWQLKHQLLLYTAALALIATANGLYTNYLNQLAFSWYNYGRMMTWTFGLGLIPIGFLVLTDYNRRMRQHLQSAQLIEAGVSRESNAPAQHAYEVQIITQTAGEQLLITDARFLMAEAEGNYIMVYQLSPGGIDRQLYRLPLSKLEAQLAPEYLMRCHRSYLVNLQQVQQVKGNAQGLRLLLHEEAPQVPVSRKYIAQVQDWFARR